MARARTGPAHPDHRPPRPAPRPLAGLVGDPLALTRATTTLTRRGIVGLCGSHALQLHRVPAALLRARIRHQPTHPWAQVVVRLLHAALPADVWNNPAVWPLWQQLLPHVLAATHPDRDLDHVANEVSWLLDSAATYRQTRGEPRAALPLFQRAYAEDRARLGDDHPHTLAAANNLANNLRELGEHQQARALNEDTLTRCRRLLGDDHPDTLASASNLAADLSAVGEHQQARALNEDTLSRRRRVLGDDHPSTLNAASNLAVDLSAVGEHQQARTLNEDTLTRRRRVLGDDHPDTLTSANNLAADLRQVGEHQQARTLDEDTLTRRRVLGDDHPDTLTSANNLAADLEALGEDQTAASWREWATGLDAQN